ncbi:MAG TPA: hypothetical protein VKV33_09575 [Streptosporangiaceae bacterium]|nr:hypothetical protein [Streptosporangiaceae bacterium]
MSDVTAEGQRAEGAAADGVADVTAGRTATGERTARRLAVAGIADQARRARRLPARHWQFCVVLAAAVAMRCIVILGYPPIFWFNDSYNYLTDAVTRTPDIVRSDGYPLLLLVLLPFHSVTLLAVLQALMGLAMGAGIYALLRRRGLPWWGATLPALPVLFDVFEMQLEHMVMSDVLFTFLVTMAVIIVCWFDRPPLWACVAVGLIVGYSAIVRTVGEPLLVLFAAGMLLRRLGWKRVAATVATGILPIIGYMIWYHGFYGQYALDGSSGTFLYSRVSSFAECSKMSLPQNLTVLCDPTPPAQRQNSQEYLWTTSEPLYRVSRGNQFSKHADSIAGKFAEHAILSQPLSYLRVVAHDTLHTFTWTRSQSDVTGSGPSFQFRDSVDPVPWWATYYPQNKSSLLEYTGRGKGQPRVVQPWAHFIEFYQKWIYLRGTMLGVIVLIGAAGVIARWRRWGGLTLLPWALGAALIVLPPMTAGFSYRYVMAAIPVACLAAGLALTREPRTPRPRAANPPAAESRT